MWLVFYCITNMFVDRYHKLYNDQKKKVLHSRYSEMLINSYKLVVRLPARVIFENPRNPFRGLDYDCDNTSTKRAIQRKEIKLLLIHVSMLFYACTTTAYNIRFLSHLSHHPVINLS